MFYRITWLSLILFLLSGTGGWLEAQGLERILQLRQSGPTAVFHSTGLPDGSVVYMTTSVAGRIDPEGEILWRTPLGVSGPLGGFDTLDNSFWVAGQAVSSIRDRVQVREWRVSMDGEILDDRVTELDDLRPTLEEITPSFVIRRGSNDTLHIYVSVRDQSETTFVGVAQRIHYYKLDENRNVVASLVFREGEYCGILDAYPLPGGRHAVLMKSDPDFDGETSQRLPVLVARVDEEAVVRPLDTFPAVYFRDPFLLRRANGLFVAGYRGSTQNLFLREYDLLGMERRQRADINTPVGPTRPQTAEELPDGSLLLLEEGLGFAPGLPTRFLYQRSFDLSFNEEWSRIYGLPEIDVTPTELGVLPGEEFYALGMMASADGNGFFVRAAADGTTFPHHLRGQILVSDPDCVPVADSTGLPNWWIRLLPLDGQPDTLYAFTGPEGRFALRVDAGRYQIEPISPNAYWEVCPPNPVSFSGVSDTLEVVLGASATYDCPMMTVAVNTPYFLPRCEPYTTRINYRNQGAAPAASATVRVIMDPLVEPLSSVPVWDQRRGDTLWFELGEQSVGQAGDIHISGAVDCETAVVGQAHCTEAKIFPDSLCTPPGINWDGSSLLVSGRCEADTVFFRIENIGVGDMAAPRQYVITEDVVLHFGGEFELESGQSLEIPIPASGATYRLTAEQDPGHPGNSQPSVVVEGCGAAGQEDFQTGIFGQYPQDDGDPFIDISCRQNADLNAGGLWSEEDTDESQKSPRNNGGFSAFVHPTGIGEHHLIDTGTVLQYEWRFENRTEATIRYLRFRNPVAESLRLGSLMEVTATEAYDYRVSPQGEVSLSFRALELAPGEELTWSYRVALAEGIPPGTEIINEGEISFGAQPYQKANPATVRVRTPERYAFTEAPAICSLNAEDLPELLRQRDTVFRPEYDSITLTLSPVVPAYRMRLDTLIAEGDSLRGQLILTDVEIVDSLKTVAGCDSVVIYAVMVDPGTSTEGGSSESSWSVFPNPAGNFFMLRPGRAEPVVSISLRDLSGRLVRDIRPASPEIVTGEGLFVPVSGLPSAWYLVMVRTDSGVWVSRVFIRGD